MVFSFLDEIQDESEQLDPEKEEEEDAGIGKYFSKALFTRYRITYVSDPLSYRIGAVFYTTLHDSDMLCNNPAQLCSASAGRRKMDPAQSVPFCFRCKHRNSIRNAPKLRFDNRMASVRMRLINWLTNRQRKQQIW